MQKLKTRKGNLLLEGIVSLFIGSLLILCSFQVYLISYKIKSENKLKESYISILDAVSKEIIYNKDYHFIESIKNNNRYNIPSEYMNMSSLEKNDIDNLFINKTQDELPYLNINIEEGPVYKIRLTLYYEKSGRLGEIYSDLYKGKY